MLIHICADCRQISINRIASDDNPQQLFELFERSLTLDVSERERLELEGIKFLSANESRLVKAQLFGVV